MHYEYIQKEKNMENYIGNTLLYIGKNITHKLRNLWVVHC